MRRGAFRAPWGNAVGTQTMYCGDCHGSNTADNSVVPAGDSPRADRSVSRNDRLKIVSSGRPAARAA